MATHMPYLEKLGPEEPERQWDRDLETPAYLRRPRALPRLSLLDSGELEQDEESPGVSATHWAPIPPRWTTDPPVRPGDYHCRRAGDDGYAIVRVLSHAGRLFYGWSDINYRPVPAAPRHGQPAELEWSSRRIPEPLP